MTPAAAAPVVHLSRRYRFSASHRLHVDGWTEVQNEETFGKCNNPHGHGHNYVLELTVSGPVDDETGRVLNMVALDRTVQEKIITRFDLQNLNCDSAFTGSTLQAVPSTENLCRTAWQLLQPGVFGTAQLEHLRIEETANNSFDYRGESTLPSADEQSAKEH